LVSCTFSESETASTVQPCPPHSYNFLEAMRDHFTHSSLNVHTEHSLFSGGQIIFKLIQTYIKCRPETVCTHHNRAQLWSLQATESQSRGRRVW